jgi:hypothetical protein
MAPTAASDELYQKLKLAVGAFLVEFTAFESNYLRAAIATLSTDAQLVSHVMELLELEGRLKLLKRMAEVRQVPDRLMQDLQSVLSKARKLRDHRNEIAHNPAVVDVSGEPFAGVHLPRSKVKRPSTPMRSMEELVAVRRSWMRSLEDIEGYTRDTLELQRAMHGIIERLFKHTSGIWSPNV